MKIFLISPVRTNTARVNIDLEIRVNIENYVKKLEEAGHKVHWPIRDTKQDDPTGGYNICRQNFQAMIDADEIHIWYLEESVGSKFDLGGLFMLVEMLNCKKKIVRANKGSVSDVDGKSFYKVLSYIADN